MGIGYILHFDIAALALLVIVLASNLILGLTKGRTNRLFITLVGVAILATLGDLLSGYGANVYHPSDINEGLMYAYNYVYFFAHNNITLVYFLYCFSSMGIWHSVKNKRWIMVFMVISMIISNGLLVVNVFNHKVFYIDQLMCYQRGPWLTLNYVIFAINCLLGTIVMIVNKKIISTDKLIIMLSILPANGLAFIIQGIYGKALVEMFMIAMEITMLVILIQRRDEKVDPITGAKKYNDGIGKLQRMIKTDTPFAIIFIKLVNYKNISTYLGQKQYNVFLGDTAKILRDIAKENEMGAEQYYLESGLFAFVAEEADMTKIDKTAEKIKDHYMMLRKKGDYEVSIDARICIVSCPDDIKDYNTLVSLGLSFHRSLPAVKDVLYYKDFSNRKDFIIRNNLETIIKNGLKDNNFSVYYQPIYSNEYRRYVAAEALVRLHDPVYGDISPAVFIPTAERMGCIHDIGNFVLRDVCRFLSENDIEELGLFDIQINLSPTQCVEASLVDRINESINSYKIKSSNICLEINEAAADLEPEIVDRNMKILTSMGVKFVLDNYGAGYSNLRRLLSLPIEVIKLDREFVNQADNRETRIIVEETIQMLKQLNKKVVVTGIEREETARLFEDMGCEFFQGCEFMQGFFFCTALPETEFVTFIKRNKK